MKPTDMIRPFWIDKPELQDVTVLICQNKTPDLIRLCIESLLTFYPTIPVLIVNGTPDDEAGKWCKLKASQHNNIKVWDRVGYDSHGVAMHEAALLIETPYVLTLDSDIIVKRGGWIEDLCDLITEDVFASGMLMIVSDSKDACGWTDDQTDQLNYIHPSTCMFDRAMYIDFANTSQAQYGAKFTDHGAPSVRPMQEAKRRGIDVIGFPVEDYVMHLSGASWTSPRTVWSCDNGVMVRPLVTFISDTYVFQTDKDYDIIPFGNASQGDYVIHGKEPVSIDNNIFDQRLRVTGEFICPVINGHYISNDVVSRLRTLATQSYGDVIVIDNLYFYRREYYQNTIAWK